MKPCVRGACLLAVLLPLRATAQTPDTTAACDGLPVRSVEVRTNRPVFRGALAWWRKFARSLGLHHETTSPDLVRRFVSLDVGRPCTEFRRSESERILRAQPYIADATVSTSLEDGGVGVEVETVDEVPPVGSARIHGASIRALSLGTINLVGSGMHLEGRWEQGRAQRDGFGASFSHHQVLGRPYIFDFDGGRRPLGEHYAVSMSHPFLSDLQRVAWHAGYWTSKHFARLTRSDRAEFVQPVDRTMWNVGGVLRFGPPHRLGLVGGMIIGERSVPRHEVSQVDSTTGALIPADTAGFRTYPTYDATNVAGVLGMRALTFSRVRSLDAVAGEQDFGTGTQITAALGVRPMFDRPLRDAFGAVDAYAATRAGNHYMAVRADVESRLDIDNADWRHLIASGKAAWYIRPAARWTSELSVEGVGGWRTIMPFQLDLGERRSGVRGYTKSRHPGGQRLVTRLEQRFDLARYQTNRAAIGAAAFADAGRMWAGDVPFGEATPARASIGVALLTAVPARSERTMRLELAVPLHRSTGARTELRFTVREPSRGFWYEPRRISWARLSAVPEQIFSWP